MWWGLTCASLNCTPLRHDQPSLCHKACHLSKDTKMLIFFMQHLGAVPSTALATEHTHHEHLFMANTVLRLCQYSYDTLTPFVLTQMIHSVLLQRGRGKVFFSCVWKCTGYVQFNLTSESCGGKTSLANLRPLIPPNSGADN